MSDGTAHFLKSKLTPTLKKFRAADGNDGEKKMRRILGVALSLTLLAAGPSKADTAARCSVSPDRLDATRVTAHYQSDFEAGRQMAHHDRRSGQALQHRAFRAR